MAHPVISYPGAKWRFYPHMVDYFPTDMKTFIEPFLGGASVTLSVADDIRFNKLERMIAGDLSPEMWAFWIGVKKNPSAVEEIATKWFKQMCPTHATLVNHGLSRVVLADYIDGKYKNSVEYTDEQKKDIEEKLAVYNKAIEEATKFWEWSQSVDTSQMSLEERAARIILVNKISFSGMGDSGSLSKDQFCDFRLEKLQAMYDASKLLNRVEIYNASFEDTMKFGNEEPETSFIFLDPPYAKQEGSGLYGRNGDMHKGFPHEHFAEFTKQMKCKWFMTYDDSVIVRKLFQGSTAIGDRCYIMPFTIPGGYTMAGKTAEDALAGEELFISNYDINNINNIGLDDF